MSRQEEDRRLLPALLPAEEEKDSASIPSSHWQRKTILRNRGSEQLLGTGLSSQSKEKSQKGTHLPYSLG